MMSRRPGPLIVMCTVLLVHVAFTTATYHVSEVKFFIFTAGVLALLAVVWADVAFGRQKLSDAFRERAPRQAAVAVLAFLVLSAASVVWARYRAAALFRVLEVFLYVAWALLVATTFRSRREVSHLLNVFLVAGVLTAAAAFACYPFYELHRQQVFLPMGTSNWLAACLLIPMMLCVEGFCRNVFRRERHVKSAALFGVAFLFMAPVFVLSESESAAVAFGLALAALPVLLHVRRRWLITGVIAGVLVLGCVGDLTLGKPGRLRSFAASKSVNIRLSMWRWGLKLARRNPVSGLGAGGYFPNVGTVSAGDITRKPGYYADINLHAHCEPLEVLVEVGVLGLAAFLLPPVVCLRGVVRLGRDGPTDDLRLRLGAFAAGWLAVLLQSFVTVGMRFWGVPVVFWTGVGLMLAALRVVPRPEADTPSETGRPLSRRTVNVGIGVLAVLIAAGGYFVVFRGFRASMAMKQTIYPMGADRRTRLLTRTAEESAFFVARVRARNALGRHYQELGRPADAARAFETVLDLAGDYCDTKLLLAETHLERGSLGDAMPLMESYGTLRPADPRTADDLVRFLAGLPEATDARDQLNRLFEAYPECGKVHVAAGKIGLMLDPPQPEAVRRHFTRALELNPSDAHAAYLLGIETLKVKDYAGARELLKRSYDTGLRMPLLYLNLARMERMFGDEARARELLEEGVRLFPKSPELKQERDGQGEATG